MNYIFTGFGLLYISVITTILLAGCAFSTKTAIENSETVTAEISALEDLPTTSSLTATPQLRPGTINRIEDATFTPLPTVDPTPSPTISPTPTPPPWIEQITIGQSVQDRPINMFRIGWGNTRFVIVGAIHGGDECNTSHLVNEFQVRLNEQPELLPESVVLYLVPALNPDGCAIESRSNASGVDLNRNWSTANWTPDASGPSGLIPGSGGPSPFSEPETQALSNLLMDLASHQSTGDIYLILYHAAVPNTGLVQPGYREKGVPDPEADLLAHSYASASGYLYSATWVGNYVITGEAINWAAENSIVAIDVELPDHDTVTSVPPGWQHTHLETNWQALLSVMRQASGGEVQGQR